MTGKQSVARHKAAAIVGILLVGLVAFEMFNFDTTRFALEQLMGGRRFMGLAWGTVLALAFCSIDFAGLARILTPAETMAEEPREVWWLTGAWLLGAGMNATMTWYAMALLIAPRGAEVGASLLTWAEVLRGAPVFIAVMVWLTRVLLIGSMALALERVAQDAAGMRRATASLGRPQRAPVRESRERAVASANGREE